MCCRQSPSVHLSIHTTQPLPYLVDDVGDELNGGQVLKLLLGHIGLALFVGRERQSGGEGKAEGIEVVFTEEGEDGVAGDGPEPVGDFVRRCGRWEG